MIGMVIRRGRNHLLIHRDRPIEVVDRSRPLESTMQRNPQIVKHCGKIGMVVRSGCNRLLLCRDRYDTFNAKSNEYEQVEKLNK